MAYTDIDAIEELIPKLAAAAKYRRVLNEHGLADLYDAVRVIAAHIAKVEHDRRMLEDADDD